MKKLFTDALIKVLILLRLRTKQYPKGLLNKRRAEFIERVKKFNKK